MTTSVIFDCDGLLLDTEYIYTKCIQDIVSRFGKEFTWEVKRQMMGRHLHEASTIMLRALEVPMDPAEFVAELEPALARSFADVPALPGVERTIAHLHQHGVKIAVATSASREHFDIKASKHPWFSKFGVIVCGDDPEVKKGKPSPDIFLVAAQRLGAHPAHCVVFEDAPNGVEAAIAAGMRAVAIPDSNIDRALVAKATVVLNSMEHFDPVLFGLPPW